MATNHKPRIRGTDSGIWRRIRLVPFTQTIPEDKQDLQLPEVAALQQAQDVLLRLLPPHRGGALEQLVRRDLQHLRQPDEDRQAQLGIGVFNVAHVNGGDAHLLRQLILGEAPGLPDLPDALSDSVVIDHSVHPV